MPTLRQERALFVLLPYLRPTKFYAPETRTMFKQAKRRKCAKSRVTAGDLWPLARLG